MSPYTTVLFLHLAAALCLFIAFGMEWAANAFLRRAASTTEVQAWLRLAHLGPLFSGPALGVLVLTGGYLAYLTNTMKQSWIPVSLLAIVIVFLPGTVINIPRMGAIRKALSGAVTPELVARLRDPILTTSVRMRAFLGLGIVFLMAVKPPLQLALLALVASAILGAIFALPAWRNRANSSAA